MIIQEIADGRKEARKDVNRVIEFNILMLLYAELETIAKRNSKDVLQTADADVVSAINKLVKSNNEVISLSGEVAARKFVMENVVLQAYLPKELSEDEVRNILENSVFGSVKEGLATLDIVAKGQYDKARAVKLINLIL